MPACKKKVKRLRRKGGIETIGDSEGRYRSLFEQAVDAIVVVDVQTGQIAEFNDKACEMLGYTRKEFSRLKLSDIEVIESQREITAHMKRIFRQGGDIFETKQRKKDGTICDVLLNIKPISIAGRKYAQGIWRDITQINRAREELRNERDRAQMYFDVAGVIFVVLDVSGKVILINRKGCEILGRDELRIIGKNWFDRFVSEDSRENVKDAFAKLMSGKVKPVEYFENPIIGDNGEERIIAWHNAVLKDKAGNVTGTISSGQDVTERKLAEEKLRYNQQRLKMLATKLSLAEEQERRRIAMGIHDDIGQKLAVAKIRLQALSESLPRRDKRKEFDEVCGLLNEIIDDIRSLTFELSNPVLYEIGLEEALSSWLKNEIQDKRGLECEFVTGAGKLELDDDISIILFKAVRELLMNIIKHAGAKTVKVCISKPDNEVRISVEDDGVGFDVGSLGLPSSKGGGFGLFNIRERLEFMGGRLAIESWPRKGTRVVMAVPTKKTGLISPKKKSSEIPAAS